MTTECPYISGCPYFKPSTVQRFHSTCLSIMDCSSQYEEDLFPVLTPSVIPPFTESFGFIPDPLSSGTSSSTSTMMGMTTGNPLWSTHPSDTLLNDPSISDISSLFVPQPPVESTEMTSVLAAGNGRQDNQPMYDDVTNNTPGNGVMLTPELALSLSQHYATIAATSSKSATNATVQHLLQELLANNGLSQPHPAAAAATPGPSGAQVSSLTAVGSTPPTLSTAPSSPLSYDKQVPPPTATESSDSGDEQLSVEGGYNYELIQPRAVEDEDLVCPICKYVSRDPQQSACCGKVFCTVCIARLRRSRSCNTKCPNCRQDPVSLFHDKRSNRSISNLQVYCKRKKKGCVWIGVLGEVDAHLRTCLHQRVSCGNNCGKRTQRKYLDRHMQKHCPNRPAQCEDCGEKGQWRYIKGSHLDKCQEKVMGCSNRGCTERFPRRDLGHHLVTCPMRLIQCRYSDVGCTVTCTHEDMVTHERDHIQDHLESAVRVARVFTSPIYGDHLLQIAPVVIRVPCFSQLNPVHHTQPFLTAIKGYKVCLILTKKSNCIEFSFSLTCGAYDSVLPWPFHGKITVLILNQKEDKNHHEMSTCMPIEMGVARVIGRHGDLSDSTRIGSFACSPNKLISLMESSGFLLDDVISIKFIYEPTRKARPSSKQKKNKHSSNSKQ